jgi:hypothetical protein
MHDGLISYINLSTLTIERSLAVPVSDGKVAIGDGYLYVLPTYVGSVVSVNLSTGVYSLKDFFYGSGGRYNSYTNAIYGTRDGISPNDIERYTITNGIFSSQTDSPYHGDYAACGEVWFSPDLTRIYNGCGTVYRASTDPTRDMTYVATLPGLNGIKHLSTSAGRKRVALISGSPMVAANQSVSDNQVLLYESDYLNLVGSYRMPDFVVGSSNYPAHAKWVFFSNDSSLLHVVLQADSSSNMRNSFAVFTISLTTVNRCQASLAVLPQRRREAVNWPRWRFTRQPIALTIQPAIARGSRWSRVASGLATQRSATWFDPIREALHERVRSRWAALASRSLRQQRPLISPHKRG